MAINGLLSEDDIKPEINRIDNEKIDIEIKIDNIKEQLFSYNNVNLKKDEVNSDLDTLQNNTSFNDKKKLIDKYIKRIYISYEEKLEMYYLGIDFNVPDMRRELVFIHRNYHFAIDLMKYIIPLSEKFKKEVHEEKFSEWGKKIISQSRKIEHTIFGGYIEDKYGKKERLEFDEYIKNRNEINDIKLYKKFGVKMK